MFTLTFLIKSMDDFTSFAPLAVFEAVIELIAIILIGGALAYDSR